MLMTIENKGSVTRALDDLKIGQNVDAAALKLCDYALGKLVHIARTMLRDTPRQAADEEDIALSALQSLFDGAAHGRLPNLESRDNLWRVLYTITLRKVVAQNEYEHARRRDSDRRVESDIEAVVGHEPTPEFAAMMVDELRFRLSNLRDDTLRQIAKLLLERWSNQEIAKQLDCHVRTIERKRDLIRRDWERGPI
jgi:hypothetical protein